MLIVSDLSWDPYSINARFAQQVTLFHYGHGSYLYWFIDWINSENMTNEELQTRGISFNRCYNHDPPYYDGCDIQHSHLYMTGNYLNNNTKVYCVILCNTTPYNITSSSAIL